MNQKSQGVKIREAKIRCSVCDKYFITNIFPDRTYRGGNYFRSLDPKDKTESWECDECWEGSNFVSTF